MAGFIFLSLLMNLLLSCTIFTQCIVSCVGLQLASLFFTKKLHDRCLIGFYRSSHQRCSIKKLFEKISKYSQENSFVRVSSKVAGLQCYQKETPAQLSSCVYCEIFKNTYFEERLRMATSVSKYASAIQVIFLLVEYPSSFPLVMSAFIAIDLSQMFIFRK